MNERLAAIAAKYRRASHSPSHQLHIDLSLPKAKVLLLPGRFRTHHHVKRHVDYVITLAPDAGEQHVQRNLRALGMTLAEMGVDTAAANRELRRFEAAVRAEIWRRVLTPDGDQ